MIPEPVFAPDVLPGVGGISVEQKHLLAFFHKLWYLMGNTTQKGGIAMSIHESGEMYLEAILVLTRKNGHVRSIDVSEYLGYSKPSVSRAMGILRSGNYIQVEKDGSLILTDSGREVAEKIYERHTVLSGLLLRLGVSEETAAADACKLEHAISDESFEAIKNWMAQMNMG